MIIGPRQVRKTTMMLNQHQYEDYTFFDGDDASTRAESNTPNTEKIIFIREAQRIDAIGLTFKLITDQYSFSRKARHTIKSHLITR